LSRVARRFLHDPVLSPVYSNFNIGTLRVSRVGHWHSCFAALDQLTISFLY
jgi:hypothetical protein